jgi:hypothetical protein
VQLPNASRAATAVDGDNPREYEQLGRRLEVLATPKSHGREAGLPDTAMAAAFLRALVRLVGTHPTGTITIPTGVANLDEIELVLRALGLIRDRRAP